MTSTPDPSRAGPRQLVRRAYRAGFNRVGLPAAENVLRRRPGPADGGVTVVAVSYRTLECAQTLAWSVRHFSPPGTRLTIVDNASGAALRRWLGQDHWFRSVRLPLNVGHGRAMDLGFALARTEYVVGLDIDAFPISADWLDVTLAPLRSGDADVAGGGFLEPVRAPGSDALRTAGYAGKPFVHPSLLAMRRSRFVQRRHSFRDQPPNWDTGERISLLEPRHAIIEPTSIRGPSVVGTVFGGVVYHNFYATRVRKDARTSIDGIAEAEPARAWNEALDRYLRPIPGFPL